jgi:hypothetical protein
MGGRIVQKSVAIAKNPVEQEHKKTLGFIMIADS